MMRFLLFGLLAAILPAASAPVAAQERDPVEVLERAAERYEAIESFCASFAQERIVPLLNQTTRSSGTLCQMHPAYFLMDFDDPEGDRVVADGEHLWMYYPSVNPGQVIRTRMGGAGGATFDFHGEFLEDPGGRFESRYTGQDRVTGRVTHVLALRPREPSGYVEARIWVEEERGLIRKVEIEEENESLRRVTLSDIRVDPGLDPSRFEFTLPPDARIIDRQMPQAPR